MNSKRVIAIAAATLVVGLVLGQMTSAFAARGEGGPGPAASSATEACVGAGVRFGAALRDAGGRLLDIVADLTGLSTEEVAAKRADGESIADIAAAEGVDADAVVDAALDVRTERLDALVADDTITQEQADEMLERMTDRLSDRITSTETGPNGSGFGKGRGGGRGQGGGMCGSGACGACPNAE